VGCTFTGNTGVAVPTTVLTDNLNFTGCNFEQCATNSLFVGGTVSGLSLVGCRTEGCNGNDFVIQPELAAEYVQGITVTGTVFSASDNGAADRIVLGGQSGKVRGFSITGNTVTHGADNFSAKLVNLNGDGESGVIAGNMMRGITASGAGAVNVKRAGVAVYGNENLTGKLDEQWGAADWGVEEGVFTPVDGSGAGLSLTGGGRYTKIGRMVFWQAFVAYPVTANGVDAEFGGLPFAVGGLGGNTLGRSGATVNVTNYGSAVGLLQGLSSANTNVAIFNPGTAAALTNANMSNKYLYCSGMYSIGG
jgi:hypothetical protein